MRLILSAIGFLMTTAIIFGLLLFGWGWSAVNEQGPHDETLSVTIERGQGVSAIAEQLEREGAIHRAWLMKITSRLSRDHRNLKAGEYEIPARASLLSIIDQISEGRTVQRFLTFREGLTSWQIVRILNDAPDLSGTIDTIPDEGTLLPETYAFTKGEDRNAILARMQSAMRDTIESIWPQRAMDSPIQTMEQAIILASIVEMETSQPDERARVAGVFINRLKRGMALQTDPTVIYAITKGEIQEQGKGPLGRRLLRKDLEIDSPYNTYRNAGLPPGPIANPGRDAIKATLNPETHNYIYFVADGTGGHIFAETLAEHNRNVAKWRTIRRNQQKAAP